MTTLDELRQRIDAIDGQLIDLIAERQVASRSVARVKEASGRATRDYNRERDVILAARTRATAAGVAPDVAEQLMRMLIRSSLTTQERSSVAARGAGSGRRALVIGGAGQMGRWFVDFVGSQGFDVEVSDPAGAPPGSTDVGDYLATDLQQDLIIVAAPLGASGPILEALAERAPTGVIFDVGSLKSPLRDGLLSLRRAGCRVTSVHPMFGPDTALLSGRHVIFVDLGDPEALAQARELFAPTMAEQVVMDLEEHDRLIAYVLGLSHAVNIAFFTALAESGEAAPRLAQLSSTTFDAQLDVASRVAQESPALYFEIQQLNDYGTESLAALAHAVDRIRTAVANGDREGFAALMRRGQAYLDDRRAMTERRV